MSLRLLENNEIDFFKWDSCILKSINGLPYAYSWYLNIISDKWKALILNDYEAVMPILEEKFISFIPYVRSDVLIPQLGIFTTKLLSNETKLKFFELLTMKYHWMDIHLNKLSSINNSEFRYRHTEKYELDLINTYQRISNSYTPELVTKLEFAKENKITIVRGLMPNDLLKLLDNKYFRLTKSLLGSLRILASTSIRYRIGQIYGAYTQQNNICAAILFLNSNKKAIMLVSAFTEEALASNAIELMIDNYIKLQSEKDLTFIFENIGHRKKYFECTEFGAKKMSYQWINHKAVI